jgi:hypothetical protein
LFTSNSQKQKKSYFVVFKNGRNNRVEITILSTKKLFSLRSKKHWRKEKHRHQMKRIYLGIGEVSQDFLTLKLSQIFETDGLLFGFGTY